MAVAGVGLSFEACASAVAGDSKGAASKRAAAANERRITLVPGQRQFLELTAHAKAGRGLGAVVELGHQHNGAVQSSSIGGRGSDIRIS